MIRVAMLGGDDGLRQALAARLRPPVSLADPAHADAGLILGQASVADVDHFLRAGKHVLAAAELFSAATLEQSNRLCGGLCLGVVNLDRYLPSRQLIREQVTAGKLGKPGLIRSQRWDTVAAGPDLPGPLLRDLDCVLWLMGAIPNHVYALEQSDAQGARTSLHIHLGFEDGAMALVDYACLPAAACYSSLALIGSQGAAHIDDHDNMQFVFGTGSATAVRSGEGVLALATAVQWFFHAVAAGTRTLGELGDWYQLLAVCEAVMESLRERRVLRLMRA